MPKQGDVALLREPKARELLHSKIPARLAYVWLDGTPRVVPIWFHWNDEELILGTPPGTPKLRGLAEHPKVAITIDGDAWPPGVLLIRGTATLTTVDGIVPEYAAAAERYFGEERGRAWVEQFGGMFTEMVRIAVHPEWVGLIDFETRFPNAIEKAMAGGS